MNGHAPALLALEDSTFWPGVAFGATGTHTGEVAFNTSYTGYLKERALVRHICTHGVMRAALSSENPDPDQLVGLARNSRDMNGLDLAKKVLCTKSYEWTEELEWWVPSLAFA